MLLNCTNSLSGWRGWMKDAEEEGRECAKMQIQYFTQSLQSYGDKKSDASERKNESCGDVTTGM